MTGAPERLDGRHRRLLGLVLEGADHPQIEGLRRRLQGRDGQKWFCDRVGDQAGPSGEGESSASRDEWRRRFSSGSGAASQDCLLRWLVSAALAMRSGMPVEGAPVAAVADVLTDIEPHVPPAWRPVFAEAVSRADGDESPSFAPFWARRPQSLAEGPTFELLEPIGDGASGTVHLAIDRDRERLVAVKLLRREHLATAAEDRFRDEVDTLMLLRHPSIVGVLASGSLEVDGVSRPFLAMPFVEGRTLRAHVEAVHLSVGEIVRLVAVIGEAVAHAHEHDVIHRDLKPSNVLIDAEGRPHLLDFGVARLLDAGRVHATLTKVGELVGTLPYMSPEQAAGEPLLVDARTDVYSLGVILYELVSGRLPHQIEGRTAGEFLAILRRAAAPRLASASPRVPRDLDIIVATALAHDREQRYPTVAAFVDDLNRFLGYAPIRACRPGAVRRAVLLIKRRPSVVVMTAMVIGVALAAGLWVDAEDRRQMLSATVTALLVDDGVEKSLQAFDPPARALQSEVYLRALEGYLETTPTTPQIRRAEARLRTILGYAKLACSEIEAARRAFLRGHHLYRDLADELPTDVVLAVEAGNAVVRLGDVDKDIGRYEAAKARYREGLAIHEAAERRFASNAGLVRTISWGYERLAALAAARGDRSLGWPDVIAHLDTARRADDLDPDHVETLIVMRSALTHVSGVLSHLRAEPERIVGARRAAADYATRAFVQSPIDPRVTRAVVNTNLALAQDLHAMASDQEAAAHVERAVFAAGADAGRRPTDKDALLIFAVALGAQAENQVHRGDRTAARITAGAFLDALERALLQSRGEHFEVRCADRLVRIANLFAIDRQPEIAETLAARAQPLIADLENPLPAVAIRLALASIHLLREDEPAVHRALEHLERVHEISRSSATATDWRALHARALRRLGRADEAAAYEPTDRSSGPPPHPASHPVLDALESRGF